MDLWEQNQLTFYIDIYLFASLYIGVERHSVTCVTPNDCQPVGNGFKSVDLRKG